MIDVIRINKDKYLIDFAYDEIFIVADYEKGKILWKISDECTNRYNLSHCNYFKNLDEAIECVVDNVETCCENMLKRIKDYKNE